MDANSRRMLQKLWKDRHTHPGGELQEIEQRLIRVETGLDPVATQSGAHIHLLGGSQTVDAEAIDWDALLASPLATAIPELPASEVTISQGGYYPFYVDVTFDGWFQGGDIWITRTRAGDTSQVWPPPGASDLWSSPGGSRFTDIAPAIDCEPGDVYQLWVDCGEEVTVKRTVFVPWLADRRPKGTTPTKLLVFTESGSHDFGSGVLIRELYLIGSGGGGAGRGGSGSNVVYAGGGGAGGVLKLVNLWVSGVVPFTIGEPGTGGTAGPGTSGGDTTMLGYTAKGGGGGGGFGSPNGASGGSGGGGAGGSVTGFGGAAEPGQGHAGGNGAPTLSNGRGAGGGGAGGPGLNTPVQQPDGGPGIDLSHLVGTAYGDDGVFSAGGRGNAVSVNVRSPIPSSGNGGDSSGGSSAGADGSKGIIIAVVGG